MRPGAGRRGVALVEVVVALTVSAVVVASAYAVLLAGERSYRALAATLEARQGARAAAQILAAELRGLDPTGGDIVALGPDSISIRVARGLAFVCAPPDAASGRVVAWDSLSFGLRAVDPARDRALLLRDGDGTSAEVWLEFGVDAVEAAAACADGSPGTGFRLSGPLAALDSIGVGAPIRTYERAVYRSYADGEGLWWLGLRTFSSGAWSAVSPVAGPLVPRTGLRLDYADAAGAPTQAPWNVARVDLEVRGESSVPVEGPGGTRSRVAEIVVTAVAPRNGRRGRGPAP